MSLLIVAWHWGDKYGTLENSRYIAHLKMRLKRYCRVPYRFEVVAPDPADGALVAMPGCLCRLRMFSRAWQAKRGLADGDPFVCIDLDVVLVNKIDPLFDRDEAFVILGGANKFNPCPYNGSIMLIRAGAYPELWEDFSIERVKQTPYFEFPDDQGWIWHKLGNDVATWQVGSRSGIYAFRKNAWPVSDLLPDDARLVVFPGKRDPARMRNIPWIMRHWP